MGLAQKIHHGPGLADAAADAQGDLVVLDGLVVGQL
jgi:hypothetical protein